MSTLLAIGSDPEVFVGEETTIISAIGLIGGTKKDPLPVDGGAVQEDNVLAEFNIEPATSPDEFTSNHRKVLAQLKERIGPRRDLIIKPSHRFTKEVLQNAGPKAMEFGCDPDFNAWTTEYNDAPNAYTTLRTAGGHVHVSFDVEDEFEDPFKAAIMMDYFLGIPSVLLDRDTERRSMYGKAGACRPKLMSNGDPYNGVEYRSLSNFWLATDDLMKWVFNNVKHAVEALPNFREFLNVVDGHEVQDIINNSKVEHARTVINRFNIPMPQGV